MAATTLIWLGRKGWEVVFPPPAEPVVDLSKLPPFPKDFLWGVATSAIQVEGCIDTCDWFKFTEDEDIGRRVTALNRVVTSKPAHLQSIGGAVHHGDLEVLKQDLERAVLLGLNAYRFSVEWARVQPTDADSQDDEALQYYSDAVDAMIERNLKPIVTLNHMTLPLWVLTPPSASLEIPGLPPMAEEDDSFTEDSMRGWENSDTIDAYVDYVEIVVEKLKDRVDTWITSNEPVASMLGVGYLAGVWSPGFSLDGTRMRSAYDNLLKAHVAAFRKIKGSYDKKKDSQVGVVHALLHSQVSSAANEFMTAVTWSVLGGALIGALLGGLLGTVASLGPGGPFNAIAGLLVGATCGVVIGLLVGAIWGATSKPNEEALKQWDYFFHQHFLDTIVWGRIEENVDYRKRNELFLADANSFFDLDEDDDWTPQVDFIGINYYRRANIHYEPTLHIKAAETGGGSFNNDMRYAKDPFQFVPFGTLNFSKEDHVLLTDLGWEVCPEGFFELLKRLSDDYELPILVAENGTPEELDRNRAPHILAHLQQVRRAMTDGVDIFGYCHWSLIDNFEWSSGYDANARFGLFEIDREKPSEAVARNCDFDKQRGLSFNRHITEGALAYQYLIANNPVSEMPFIEAVSRFGVLAPDGSTVVTPDQQAGAVWQCGNPRTTKLFRLYLSRLADDKWLGMVFEQAENKWFRLTDLSVSEDQNLVSLEFSHNSLSGGANPVRYTAIVRLRETDGRYHSVEGTRTDGVSGEDWTGQRVEEIGYWQKTGENPRALGHLMINCWEGADFDRFRVKYKMNTENWEPNEAVTNWEADRLTVTDIKAVDNDAGRLDGIEPVVTLKELSVSRSGDTLSGTFVDTNDDPWTWEAKRMEQDILF